MTISYAHGVSTTPLIPDTIGGALNSAAERWGDRDALVACHQQLRYSYYLQIPRYVRFTSEFPMTVTGKVQTFKIREMTVAELALARVTDVEPT